MKKMLTCLFLGMTIMPILPLKTSANHRPETASFAFDIDNVILYKTKSISSFLREHWALLLKNLFDIDLLWSAAKLLHRSAPGTAYIQLLEKKSPELATSIKEITLTKRPIEETVCIIEDLKNCGYQLHIATNMGERDFAFYQEKYPKIFNAFHEVKTVTFDDHRTTVKKPHPAYYQELLQQLNGNGSVSKTIFFIDDKKVNVAAANAQGLHGIHFRSPKQLRLSLQEYGILD